MDSNCVKVESVAVGAEDGGKDGNVFGRIVGLDDAITFGDTDVGKLEGGVVGEADIVGAVASHAN